jgi:hypothetical protein
VHAVEQLRAGVAVAAKPVLGLAVVKGRVHFTRVHHAAFTHKGQHLVRLFPARSRPHGARCARVHQRMGGSRQKAVVDEEVFFDGQAGVTPLQVTGAVALDAVAQRQVLRSRRGAYRVGLHKTQPGDGLGQRGGLEQAARHGVAAQVVQGDGGGHGRR